MSENLKNAFLAVASQHDAEAQPDEEPPKTLICIFVGHLHFDLLQSRGPSVSEYRCNMCEQAKVSNGWVRFSPISAKNKTKANTHKRGGSKTHAWLAVKIGQRRSKKAKTITS